MSLLSEVIAKAEEGPDKKENPVIAVLNISVKGKNQRLEIKKHSNHEKLGRDFVELHGINKKSLKPIVAKIRTMAEEGKRTVYALHHATHIFFYGCILSLPTRGEYISMRLTETCPCIFS